MNGLLEQLQDRNSYPASQLSDPGPDDTQIREILRCAISAPDHGLLAPWRFIIIRGDARHQLSDVFVEAAKRTQPDISAEKLNRIAEKPLRSPLIIVVVATITADHPKAPVIEQTLSAGAAAQQIQLGATALGFGSIWLTGGNAYDDKVKAALGIAVSDQITGFIYIGNPTVKKPTRKRPELDNHISEWHSPANV